MCFTGLLGSTPALNGISTPTLYCRQGVARAPWIKFWVAQLTGWGMSSHQRATDLKLIHKKQHPPTKDSQPPSGHSLLTSSSVLTTVSMDSQLHHGPQNQTCQPFHLSGPSQVQSPTSCLCKPPAAVTSTLAITTTPRFLSVWLTPVILSSTNVSSAGNLSPNHPT